MTPKHLCILYFSVSKANQQLNSIALFFCIYMWFGGFLPLSGQPINKSVLFLGNSYTAANNLPQMIADIALSQQDTLLFDSYTPGGYTLFGHSGNATSLSKMASGKWDMLVLQEQSQYPSFPISQVEAEVFPYAKKLDSTFKELHPCGETIFYMTWGRKNGDKSNCASWPPVCSYEGMDSLLRLRYDLMAQENKAVLSPVGAVWKYLRTYHSGIELYQSDESHPSVSGTYAAACCFYTVIFKKNPSLISYNPSLPLNDAVAIREATKKMVFDSLKNWYVGLNSPLALFSYAIDSGNFVSYKNQSANATSYYWDFGDGDSSSQINPIHQYPAPGSYTTKLIAAKCNMADTSVQQIIISSASGITKTFAQNCSLYPNPANEMIRLQCPVSVKSNFYIFNITGELQCSGILNQGQQNIEIAALPEGLYYLKMIDANSIQKTLFFVKQAH